MACLDLHIRIQQRDESDDEKQYPVYSLVIVPVHVHIPSVRPDHSDDENEGKEESEVKLAFGEIHRVMASKITNTLLLRLHL